MRFYGKLITVLTIFSTMLLCTACSTFDTTDGSNTDAPFTVVCTTFSQYDWVKNITKGIDDINVDYLLKNGADPHNFQPSAADIVQINNCDLLIYVGGTSDYTISEIIDKSNKASASLFNMMSYLNDKLLRIDTSEHEHTHSEAESEYDFSEYDEHIWLSLKNAEALCTSISDRLCSLLPEYDSRIKANTESYIAEIRKLDEKYTREISECETSRIVVADRFPLVYLASDYSIECFKAFDGCSSEADASFGKIVELSSAVDEYNLKYVITLEDSNTDISASVIANTSSKDQQTLCINSLQSVTSSDADNGLTYLSAMQKNLDILLTALQN